MDVLPKQQGPRNSRLTKTLFYYIFLALLLRAYMLKIKGNKAQQSTIGKKKTKHEYI